MMKMAVRNDDGGGGDSLKLDPKPTTILSSSRSSLRGGKERSVPVHVHHCGIEDISPLNR